MHRQAVSTLWLFDIEAWVANWNENPTPFVWHKSAEQILERIAGYCAAVNKATGA